MKEQILETARHLIAVGTAPSKITLKDLIGTGVCTQKELTHCYPDLHSFQMDLAGLFFGDAREAVIRDTQGLQVGLQQISAAFLSYLDYNLAHPELQEIAHHLQYTRDGWDLLMRMEAGVALIVQADLQAMSAHYRSARAQLLTSMVVSVVRSEYQTGNKLSDLREALLDYCQRSAG